MTTPIDCFEYKVLRKTEVQAWPRNLIKAIAELLHRAWPEQRSIAQREHDIAKASCDRVLILDSGDNVIAHLRLEQSRVSSCDGASAGVATSVVVTESFRGQGLGRRLLRLAEIESQRRGWGYLYVEAVSTAIHFYRRCAYIESPTTAETDMPALRLVDTSALERALRIKKAQDSIEEASTKLWMRKRILERSDARLSISPAQLESTIRENGIFSKIVLAPCSALVWERQIGPSCGLAALRLAAHALHHMPCPTDSIDQKQDTLEFHATTASASIINLDINTDYCPLLNAAKQLGVTGDGEFFNISDLARLSNECLGLHAMLLDSDRWNILIPECINKGYICIFAYDRDRNTHLPVARDGLAAHYALCLGYGVHANNQKYAIALHGIAPRPLVADIDDLYASSVQLRLLNEKFVVNSSPTTMQLARRLLILGKCSSGGGGKKK